MPSETSFTPIDAVLVGTVTSGAATTAAFDLAGCRAVGVITPGTLTSTSVSFTVSDAIDGTYVPLYDDTNSAYSVTVGTVQARGYALSPSVMAPWRYLKVTTASNEGADRVIKIVARPI